LSVRLARKTGHGGGFGKIAKFLGGENGGPEMLAMALGGEVEALAVEAEFVAGDGEDYFVCVGTPDSALKFGGAAMNQPHTTIPKVITAALPHTWTEESGEMRGDTH
jgi:hypothetical protein